MDGHLWKPRWDPEGLLSTVPADRDDTARNRWRGCASTADWTPTRKAAALAVGGAVAAVDRARLGPGLSDQQGVSGPVPTWSSPPDARRCCWPRATGSIDIKGWRRWTTPLVILGVNAITLFVASGLLVKTLALIRVAGPDGREIAVSHWAYLHWFVPFAAPKNASLLYAIANLVLLFALLCVDVSPPHLPARVTAPLPPRAVRVRSG